MTFKKGTFKKGDKVEIVSVSCNRKGKCGFREPSCVGEIGTVSDDRSQFREISVRFNKDNWCTFHPQNLLHITYQTTMRFAIREAVAMLRGTK